MFQKSMNEARSLIADTQAVQSGFDKIWESIKSVNWEEMLSELGNYTGYAANALTGIAGVQNELEEYQKFIESSYDNANKAVSEAEKASSSNTESDREKFMQLAQSYRIKAADDMKKAEALYESIYKKAPAKDKQVVDKMHAQGQSIAGRNNALAAAAEIKAKKINNLGRAVMQAKYLLNSNQT